MTARVELPMVLEAMVTATARPPELLPPKAPLMVAATTLASIDVPSVADRETAPEAPTRLPSATAASTVLVTLLLDSAPAPLRLMALLLLPLKPTDAATAVASMSEVER